MKLFTVVVYNLRMCLKEENPGLKCFKRDISKEIIICVRWNDFTLGSFLFMYNNMYTS